MVNIYRSAESLGDIAFEYNILQVRAAAVQISIFLCDIMFNLGVALLMVLTIYHSMVQLQSPNCYYSL